MSDPRLIDVAAEVRRLERAVSDAEWDDDPRLAHLARELAYYKQLQQEGVLLDPVF